MPHFKCPVCGDTLCCDNRVWRCPRGHSYDIARQGYVNLRMSNHASAKRHGDDKVMVAARRAFLDAGYYDCLKQAVCDTAVRYSGDTVELLDVGCGEGYYTCAVQSALAQRGIPCHTCGIDISREALIYAAKRQRDCQWAVASVNRLPVADASCTLLMNIFAPDDNAEFRRVLRAGGIWLRVVPLENHLMGLKAAVYDTPYQNPAPQYTPDGFTLLERQDVRSHLTLHNTDDIRHLFMMTPYYYKTGRTDQEKLDHLTVLDTELAFGIFVYRHKG